MQEKAKRNPKWTRDELILALNTYFEVDTSKISSKSDTVIRLSECLQKLSAYESSSKADTYRNTNGVVMKLHNFSSVETGKGLKNASQLDRAIFQEFVNDKQHLKAIANKIIETINGDVQKEITVDEASFPEGAVLEKLHKYRERNSKVTKQKKQSILKEKGILQCEVCGFDFQKSYGALGDGYIECHHIVPLANIDAKKETKLNDLALVCANCHRMLHRKRPWISIVGLKKLVFEGK